jgi:NADH-quinone oxidoreductase subunit M
MGPLKAGYENLSDASWNEKLSAIILVIGIIAIGLSPSWLNNLVRPATELIMQKIAG